MKFFKPPTGKKPKVIILDERPWKLVVGMRVVVVRQYYGDLGRAFVGDRGTVVKVSNLNPDWGYDGQFMIQMDREFEMFIPESLLRPLRTLELLAECADE